MKNSVTGTVLALPLFVLLTGSLAGCVGSSSNKDKDVLILPKGHKQMTAEEHEKMHAGGHDRSLGKRCIYDSETDKFYCNFPKGK